MIHSPARRWARTVHPPRVGWRTRPRLFLAIALTVYLLVVVLQVRDIAEGDDSSITGRLRMGH